MSPPANLPDALHRIAGKLKRDLTTAAGSCDCPAMADDLRGFADRADAIAEISGVISRGEAPSISVAAYALFEGDMAAAHQPLYRTEMHHGQEV